MKPPAFTATSTLADFAESISGGKTAVVLPELNIRITGAAGVAGNHAADAGAARDVPR